MRYSRRDFGKLALAGIPAAAMWRSLGGATRWRRRRDQFEDQRRPDRGDHLQLPQHAGRHDHPGLREDRPRRDGADVEPCRGAGRHAEPPGGRGGGGRRGEPATPEQTAAREAAQKAVREWRASASEGTFKPVRKQIEDAGIALKAALLQHERPAHDRRRHRVRIHDGEVARGEAITTSTQVSMAKRMAPFSDKHKIPVGFHGHADVNNPDEVIDAGNVRSRDGDVEVPLGEPGSRPLHRSRLRRGRVPAEAPRAGSRTCT